MTLLERVAYIRGLMEGLSLDEKDPMTKLVAEIVDVMDEMDDEMFNLYLQYHFVICERSDCVGTSHHILDVFRKE